jgi:very-short-patch-repair endonuclease
MWRLLREGFKDKHFRRQAPIRHYIVDFASHPAKLVIEVDGGQHNDVSDASRTATIEGEGYRVLRFWNHEVLGNPGGVWTAVAAVLCGEALPLGGGGLGEGDVRAQLYVDDHPTPTPPHQGEGR